MANAAQSLLLVTPISDLHWSICQFLAQERRRLMLLNALSPEKAFHLAIAASTRGAVISPHQIQLDLLKEQWEFHLQRVIEYFGSLNAILIFFDAGEVGAPTTWFLRAIWPDLARRSAPQLSNTRPGGSFVLVAPETEESYMGPFLEQIGKEWLVQKIRARIGVIFHAPNAAPTEIAQRIQQKLGQPAARGA